MNSRGMALLMGLLLLAAISLLAVTAGNGMVLQRRLGGILEDDRRALQNAERALALARAWLHSRAEVDRQAGCAVDCVLPVAVLGPGSLPDDPEFQGAHWWRSEAQAADTHPETGEALRLDLGGADAARWIIEEARYQPLAEDGDSATPAAAGYYRVLARGQGRQASSVAVVEAWYVRPWEGEIEPSGFPPADSPGRFCRQFSDELPCGTLAWRQLR